MWCGEGRGRPHAWRPWFSPLPAGVQGPLAHRPLLASRSHRSLRPRHVQGLLRLPLDKAAAAGQRRPADAGGNAAGPPALPALRALAASPVRLDVTAEVLRCEKGGRQRAWRRGAPPLEPRRRRRRQSAARRLPCIQPPPPLTPYTPPPRPTPTVHRGHARRRDHGGHGPRHARHHRQPQEPQRLQRALCWRCRCHCSGRPAGPVQRLASGPGRLAARPRRPKQRAPRRTAEEHAAAPAGAHRPPLLPPPSLTPCARLPAALPAPRLAAGARHLFRAEAGHGLRAGQEVLGGEQRGGWGAGGWVGAQTALKKRGAQGGRGRGWGWAALRTAGARAPPAGSPTGAHHFPPGAPQRPQSCATPGPHRCPRPARPAPPRSWPSTAPRTSR